LTVPARPELPARARESVARAIHEGYRADQAGRKPADDPALAEWDELPEHLRESNRAQAAHIFEKLRAIGCEVRDAEGDVEPVRFTDDEVELLAELEHDRWTAERLTDGWQPGARDVLAKTSPYLVGWNELPEEVREWDREPVRRIPRLLADVGLEIRRLSRGGLMGAGRREDPRRPPEEHPRRPARPGPRRGRAGR
jgi:hypothetical protein